VNASNDSNSVLCAGRLYCDLVFTGVDGLPTLGTETFADELGLHAGGGAFITAATLCALGQSAALLATIPAAPFDKIVERDIAYNVVDARQCTPAPPGIDPQITVVVAAENDRAFLSRRAGVALPTLTPDAFSNHCHLHIGELRTLLEHPDLIDLARSAGLTISLDCGWDDGMMADVAVLTGLIAQVDVFLPNEAETTRLSELGLSEKTAPLTVVKCGAQGARANRKSGWITVAASRADVVDATGAGDAFNGGFLYEWLRGTGLEQCLVTGNSCGGAVVQARGGTGGLDMVRNDMMSAKRKLAT